MIENKIPARAIEVIEFKETTEANKELYIDILTRMCVRTQEFNKFYDQGAVKHVVDKMKTLLAVDWDTQTEAQRKQSEGYIRLASAIAKSTINADKLIESELADQLMTLFSNPKIPTSVMESTVEPMVTMSNDATAKRLFKEKGFKMETFTKLLDEIDNDSVVYRGSKFIANLATDEDMQKSLDGIRNESEDSIQFFCHLVGVDRLIPELIKSNPIELLLNTISKIQSKSPVKTKPLMHCINALSSIFKAHPDSCKTFFDLKGQDILIKSCQTKDVNVVSAIFQNQTRLVELGPADSQAKIVQSGIIDSLTGYWSGVNKISDEIFGKIEKFGGKKFIDTSYANGNSKEDRRIVFNQYKDLKSLTKNGLTFMGLISEQHKNQFEKVSSDFIGSCIKLLNSFSGDYNIQTGGVMLISSLPMNEKNATFCIQEGLIETLFREKMNNPLWKKIGLADIRLINAMVQTGKPTITKLVKADAAKVIVALIHFMDEVNLETAEDGTVIRPAGIPESDELAVKEKEEIASLADPLIDVLIELPTIKKIRTNLDALTKGLTGVPKDDVTNKIRIELATLSCANRLEKFATESAKQDLAYFSEQLGKKIAGLKDFDGKIPILSDIAKVFNSWIYSTRNERAHQVFGEKTVGDLYFRFGVSCLDKCMSDKTAANVMSNLANGLGDRVKILASAREEVRPKLTRGGTVIGIDPDKDEAKITTLTDVVSKMMKNFTNNSNIQKLGCEILKYIAILSDKGRTQMN